MMPMAQPRAADRIRRLNYTPEGQEWARTPTPQKLWSHIATLQATIRRQEAQIEYLSAQARNDALTGLLNRRGFEEAMETTLANCQRYAETGSLIMIDLNRFKPINDTFGHAAGDALLRHVAKILQMHVRKGDLVARLGGDEFVIFLAHAPRPMGECKVQALASLVESFPLTWQSNWREDETTLVASLSFGVADTAESLELPQLLHLADERMYTYKQELKVAR